MKLRDLLGVITGDAQVIVLGEFDKITASADVLYHSMVYRVLNSKVIEVSPVGKNTVQVLVNDNECEE